MKTSQINWKAPTTLYVFTYDQFVKFGITSNWTRRFKVYDKELGVVNYTILKKIEFDTRWKAELVEQIVKWRLRRWAVYGTHEWINLPVQIVLDCIHDSIKELENEYEKHKYIHKRGKDRFAFYKHIASIYFDNSQ